ncbi:RNA polymerase sigma factor RpoD/SigA [Candidatus Auribacterota bacterium]
MQLNKRPNSGKDSIHLYLRDIGEIPLLNRDEEISLAKKVQKGNKQAKREMIRSNLRLVVSIAKRYANYGVPFLDLIEEGNIGLMKAVDKYDLSKGCKFSTYATWWIKQSIFRALSNLGKTIRIPMYMVERLSTLNKVIEELTQCMGRVPLNEDIAKELDIPLKKVREMREIIKKPSSLYASIGSEGEGELIDIVPDVDAIAPDDFVAKALLREDVLDILSEIPDREANILVMRYGLKDGKPMTLEEIGTKYKVSRERVRQIENSGVRKLRKILMDRKRKSEDYI